MDVSDFAASIQHKGYCIVEDVIPENKVHDIRQRVVAAQQAHHAEAEAELAKTRARGHRIGVPGVGLLKQALNATQCFAPYLADERIMGIAESFFGDFVRISCTDCVINHPGTKRGYWHADWPYQRDQLDPCKGSLSGRDDASFFDLDADAFHAREWGNVCVAQKSSLSEQSGDRRDGWRRSGCAARR